MVELVASPVSAARLVTSTVAMPDARRRPTVEDLLRVYPPNPALRAPRRPGEFLYQANRGDAESSLIDDCRPLEVSRSPFAAELARWRATARRRLIAEAYEWSATYRDGLPQTPPENATLLLSGHQPEFFHPGVWFKNFALSEEARASARPVVPINVLIDYDLCTKRSVAHPAIVPGGVRTEALAIDRDARPAPYELATIVDRDFIRTFPQRLAEFRGENWPQGTACPIAAALFEQADDLLATSSGFGDFAARARHRFEGSIGLSTLEVPFSELAVETSFFEFAHLLFREADTFRAHYDAAIRTVRRVQGLRSKTHPAPELVVRDGWTETPFWIWTKDDPTRRRLFVRRASDGRIELSDLAQYRKSLAGDGREQIAVEQLAALAGEGVAIRPRALLATLWMRMILGDVFVHGIGGAKYDQAADLLMTSFFGVSPPIYLIATATATLTGRTPAEAASNLRRSNDRLRDLEQHPERYLANDPSEAQRSAQEEIERTIADATADGLDTATDRRLRDARSVLRARLDARIETAREEVAASDAALRAERTLDARDRSLLLFDAETLPERLAGAARRAVAARKSSHPATAGTE